MKRTEGTLSFRTQQTEVLSKNQEFRFHPFCTYLQVFFFFSAARLRRSWAARGQRPPRSASRASHEDSLLGFWHAAWPDPQQINPKPAAPPAAPASPGETPALNPPQLLPAGLCSPGDLQVGIWGDFFFFKTQFDGEQTPSPLAAPAQRSTCIDAPRGRQGAGGGGGDPKGAGGERGEGLGRAAPSPSSPLPQAVTALLPRGAGDVPPLGCPGRGGELGQPMLCHPELPPFQN